MDEITGYTDLGVYIPRFAANDSLITSLTIRQFKAIRNSGFSLDTVGGIRFVSEGGISASTPGNLTLGSVVGGDVVIQGKLVNLTSFEEDLRFAVAGESIIASRGGFDLNVIENNGTVNFFSTLKTTLSAADSLILSSTNDTVQISAEQGAINIHNDLVALVASEILQLGSLEDILVRASREFDALSYSSTEINAFTRLSVDSISRNIEFQAQNDLLIQADSNVYVTSSDDLHFETLLGDISLRANDAVSLYGRSLQHNATDINFSAAGALLVTGDGHLNLYSKNDVVYQADSSVWLAYDSTEFIGLSDADILFDLNSAFQSSSQFNVETANVNNSAISVVGKVIAFQTFSRDAIHVKASSLQTRAPLISFYALDGSVDLTTSPELYSAGTLGSTSFRDGSFGVNNAGATTVRADNTISLKADGLLGIVDDTFIQLNAGRNVRAALNGFYFNANNTQTFNVGATARYYGNDLVRITSGTFTSSATNHSEINTQFQQSFTINSSVSYSNIDDMTTTVREGRYALSSLSLTDFQASDVALEGQSVTFKSAAGAVDGNPTSRAFFITKDGLTVTSANFTSVSQETTELSVPSGDGVFTAGNDIVLTSGEDAIIESVTGDINFVGDALLDATAENIVFRTGNGLQLSGNNTIVFNTTSIVFQSASDIVLASDGLIVSSNDSVAFNAGYSAEFISRTDFDITSAGDIGLTGGRITLAAKGDLTLDVGSVDFSSADRNNIEFYARDGEFAVNTLSANTTYSANDVRLVSQSESDDVGFSTVALNGDVTITSLGDLNITQALAGLGNGTAFSAQINNNTLFQGQYYLETSSLTGGDITYSVNGSNTLAATTSYNLMYEDSFLLLSDSDVVLTGGDITFTILPYNQEEETDNSSSFDFSNDINLTSCIGNLTTESPTLAISGETLLVSQSASSCNGTTVPVGSSFDIITHADRYQLITTVGDHIYQALDNVSLQGGRVTGTAAGGTLTITSDNNVDIRSQNEDNLFADETDDRFYGQQVTFNASTTATFVQHGLSSDGDYSLDRHYGIRVDTQVGDLELRIPDSYFNVTALEGRVVLVAGELSNFDIVNTRSLFVDAGEGAVLLSSHGYVTNDTVTPSTAIQFFAALGNIAINAPLATVSLSGNQPANPNNDYFSRGLQVQSRFQNVNITAARNIEQYSSDLDGALNYFSLTQDLPVVAPEGISISSGDRYFSMKSDVRVNSARNLLVNTSGQQIYRASGPSTVENNPAIILRAQDGSILFTTPDDQQFLASGSLTFDSANDQIVADVADSIYLTGTSQILLASTLNSAAVVTGPGDITVRGRAGGASVTFASDLAQAIEATAGGKINSYARHDAEYYASTGFLLDTNQGSVLFDQQGRGESRYHSGGSLLLSAAAARGVRFEGQDYWANAGRDITIDATQQFSIGATSLTDTATSPTQTFNAGGTIGNVGLLFDILGGETWTVSGRGPVNFESVRATWTAVGDISLQSNGPVVFLNKGEFAQASLVINTESSFTMAAGRSVEFASNDTLQLSAPNIIEFLAKGASTEDVSQISSNNNWVVNAPALNMFTGTFEGGARDFSVTAASVINFETEVGQGGSILVDSDSYTTVSAVGPVYLESSSTFDVFTQGIDNDIEIIAENSNVSISSGGSFNTDSRTSRIQAFNGATLNAVDGDFTVEASGNIELTANGTANYQAIESILIKVDFPQDLGQVRLNVSSRGDLSFNATESIELISADVNDPFIITADADLLLRNSAPRRPSEQGDVIFTGSSYAFNSRGDATVNSNVIANNIYAGDYTLSSGGDQTYTTTAAGASILVETAGNIVIHSADQLTFAALTTLTVNTGDIVWEQDEQNGYGGIVIGSTATNAATVFTFAGASTFAAEDAIRGNTNGYLLFKTPGDISITATSEAGANVQIENQGTGGVQVNTRIFAATSAGDAIDDVLRVSAVGGVVNDDVFPLSVNAATISFAANDGLRGDINVQSSYNVQFNNPKLTTPTSIDIESQEIIIDANGYNYDRFGRTYAVSIEIDETIAFDAGDNVMFASMRGATNVVASETLKFTASQTFNAYAGHDLVIRTGFTPQPNQQPPDRSGIVFSAQGNGAVRAAAGDITLSAEDVSWSTATQLNMRSVGSTTFSSPLSLMSWVSQSSITFNADSIQFYGTRRGNFPATDVLASNSVTFRSRSGIQVFSGNIFLQGSGAVNVIADEIDFINADAIKEYNFNSNFGNNNGVRMFVNNFIIPLTDGDAGLSQTNLATSTSQNDLTRGVEENHYPTCVNRQFTYDSQTGYVCYCQFSKWRCNRLEL